jgi:hypothetical protein
VVDHQHTIVFDSPLAAHRFIERLCLCMNESFAAFRDEAIVLVIDGSEGRTQAERIRSLARESSGEWQRLTPVP